MYNLESTTLPIGNTETNFFLILTAQTITERFAYTTLYEAPEGP